MITDTDCERREPRLIQIAIEPGNSKIGEVTSIFGLDSDGRLWVNNGIVNSRKRRWIEIDTPFTTAGELQ